ncbi:MAG: hypothetical protein ACP5QM_07280 [Caldisericum sp.]|uniref:hypothetical protein n=1 Tax=Caldisericum sp. TaxID=2499687 RepID=UPI003D13524B
MIKELKYNFEMLFKGIFFIELGFLFGILTFVVSGSLKGGELSLILNGPYSDTFISRYFLLVSYFLVIMLPYFTTSETIIYEKLSGRIEQLLVNGFKPFSYFWGSALTVFILNEIMLFIVFSEFYIFRFYFFPGISVIYLIEPLVAISIFSFGLSNFLCAVVLKIKKVDLIKGFLFVIPYILVFGGNNLITKIKPEYNIGLLLGTAAIGLLLFALSILIMRNINNESIVLTIP